MNKRFLVVVHADAHAGHWTAMAERPRAWDLFVCHAGRDGRELPSAGEGMVRLDRSGPRWPTLGRLLADTREAWQSYDFVWLPAEAVRATPSEIETLFETAATLGLHLAQPDIDGADISTLSPLFSTVLLSRALPSFDEADPASMLHRWEQQAALPPVAGAEPVVAAPVVAAAARSAVPRLSVIVPTFDRAAILQRCLRQLAQQTLPADAFEVIVVDDGSADATPQVLAEAARTHGVVALQQVNLGPAAARNRALQQARGERVLFLNDDAWLEPQALQIHLEEHARRGPRAAVLGAFTMHPEHMRLDRPVGHCLDHSDLIFEYAFMQPDRPYGHRQFYTCNLSLDREFVLRHGGFDEGFVRMGAEDIELGMRLERQGCQVFYRPDAVARHAHRLDAPGLARMFRFRGRGGVHVFVLHPEFDPHYAGMTLGRRDSLLALDARLGPALARLEQAIAHHDALEFVATGAPVPLSQRASGIDLSMLWMWPDAEIERLLGRLAERLERELASPVTAVPRALEPAAGRVYPALQFIKWYHDTLGMLSSPELPAYLEGVHARRRDALSRAA